MKDDRLTLAAIAALAYIVADLLHEGLGHGMTAWLSGARVLTISTVALQSDIGTRWISASGTLVNLIFGAIFWLLLRKPQGYTPATRYFLVLTMAGNLFTGTGYFFFSGVTNFGDWAAVIQGQQPLWLWRLGLIAIGAAAYYGSLLLVAEEMRAFRGEAGRLREASWTPYFIEAILAALGGLLNPAGLFYVVAAALPSTLGANAGLLALPSTMRGWSAGGEVSAVRRSAGWIAAGAIASLLFVFVIGRGLTWHIY